MLGLVKSRHSGDVIRGNVVIQLNEGGELSVKNKDGFPIFVVEESTGDFQFKGKQKRTSTNQ